MTIISTIAIYNSSNPTTPIPLSANESATWIKNSRYERDLLMRSRAVDVDEIETFVEVHLLVGMYRTESGALEQVLQGYINTHTHTHIMRSSHVRFLVEIFLRGDEVPTTVCPDWVTSTRQPLQGPGSSKHPWCLSSWLSCHLYRISTTTLWM